MSYTDEADVKLQSGRPHPDANDNVNFFYKLMGRVIWLPNDRDCPLTYEVHDKDTEPCLDPESQRYVNAEKIKEYKCVMFFFPHKGVKNSTIVSFHQPARKTKTETGFREELCAALNFFGEHGWIEHKFKNADGSPKKAGYVKPENKPADGWDKLFGNQ